MKINANAYLTGAFLFHRDDVGDPIGVSTWSNKVGFKQSIYLLLDVIIDV
jgi:hypothetical protein